MFVCTNNVCINKCQEKIFGSCCVLKYLNNSDSRELMDINENPTFSLALFYVIVRWDSPLRVPSPSEPASLLTETFCAFFWLADRWTPLTTFFRIILGKPKAIFCNILLALYNYLFTCKVTKAISIIKYSREEQWGADDQGIVTMETSCNFVKGVAICVTANFMSTD